MTTVVLTVVAIVASLIAIYLFVEEMRERFSFGWKHVNKLVRKLIDELRSSSFDPDTIVGVGRGGAILAGMLAGNMGQVPLAVLDTEVHQDQGVTSARLRNPDTCPSVKGQSVLLVVGELFTGEDLKAAIGFIQAMHPRELKTLTLLTHRAASVNPDFVGMETNRPLSAPWRISDHYRDNRI